MKKWHAAEFVSFQPNFSYPEFNKFSSHLQDLIRQMLVVNPTKRITVHDALNHCFFKENGFETIEPEL